MGFSYNDAISFLYNSTNYENFASYKYERFEQDLEEFISFLKEKGYVSNLPVSVHIAGSKGKGSVAFSLEKVLLESERQGRRIYPLSFTSPHYLTLMERLRFAGQNIPQEVFAHLMFQLLPEFKEFTKFDRSMTFFEMMVTLFFKASKYYQPDALIVETGLGGRLDATNVFDPEISVITTIEFEHTHLLGDSIEKIAFEKAGILKKDQIFVLAPQIHEKATKIILEQAELKQVKKVVNLADISYHNIHEFSEIVVNALLKELSSITKFNLPERIQAKNLTGRQERREFRGIEIIVDSAHTENSMRYLARSQEGQNPEDTLLVIGLNVDKHKGSLLEKIPNTKNIITCGFESARCLNPVELANSLNLMYPDRYIEVCPNAEIAIHRAIKLCKSKGLRRMIVAGSIYLAGEVLEIIQ